MQPNRIDMRTDPSMNQQGDVGSPHISRLEGDLSKINPIQHNQNTIWSECATRDNQNISDAQRTQFANIGNVDGSRRPIFQRSYQEGSTMMHHLPQSASWSNVVSSSSSPIKFTKSSDETVLTSNFSATSSYPNMDHLNQRSRSFDASEERSQDLNYLPQSIGFGHQNMTPTRPQNSWGVQLPHPPSHRDGHQPHQLPTINQGVQGPSTPLHSPMMNYTPHSHECFSPLSLCDSTDQTTPLSSPSMSPHFTSMQGHHEPPTWQLSSSPSPSSMNMDSNGFQSQPPRFRPPEPIRNFHQGHQIYGYNRSPQGYIHPRSYSGPVVPPKQHHVSNATPHQHHVVQPRRVGPAANGPMNRSPTEVLKTLLRKKACLYEPDTSSAVALITWLVGRRLAITHGFFSRQQLQLGVHSCVATKIKEGHVTRTKVNRCMQIILNSCFHYIIPRSDGSEESGDLFRQTFLKNNVNDEQLLQTLPPPWHNLNLEAIDTEERSLDATEGSDDEASQQSPRNQGKHSSTTSHAGESTDSGKRSVLLCFNENIRSASDVFRCHNEFIRDVAHAANLYLSIDDWKMFLSGSKMHKKKVISTEASAQRYFHFMRAPNDGSDSMDQQGLATFRTSWCAKRYDHDHSLCTFAHIEVNRGWLRRDPFIHQYKPVICSNIISLPALGDCCMNICREGLTCDHAHSREEIVYHPESYKKNPCNNSAHTCPMKDVCPNTHAKSSYMDGASNGYSRHGKRHHATSKKSGQTGHGQTAGFAKCPDGSPMLYIDPAPVSEYEETLLLPGLKALFRDLSTSVYNSLHKCNTMKYGIFGWYDLAPKKEGQCTTLGPVGRAQQLKHIQQRD